MLDVRSAEMQLRKTFGNKTASEPCLIPCLYMLLYSLWIVTKSSFHSVNIRTLSCSFFFFFKFFFFFFFLPNHVPFIEKAGENHSVSKLKGSYEYFQLIF